MAQQRLPLIQTKANIVLDMVVAMFAEYCAEPFVVEPVKVIYPDGTEVVTPVSFAGWLALFIALTLRHLYLSPKGTGLSQGQCARQRHLHAHGHPARGGIARYIGIAADQDAAQRTARGRRQQH